MFENILKPKLQAPVSEQSKDEIVALRQELASVTQRLAEIESRFAPAAPPEPTPVKFILLAGVRNSTEPARPIRFLHQAPIISQRVLDQIKRLMPAAASKPPSAEFVKLCEENFGWEYCERTEAASYVEHPPKANLGPAHYSDVDTLTPEEIPLVMSRIARESQQIAAERQAAEERKNTPRIIILAGKKGEPKLPSHIVPTGLFTVDVQFVERARADLFLPGKTLMEVREKIAKAGFESCVEELTQEELSVHQPMPESKPVRLAGDDYFLNAEVARLRKPAPPKFDVDGRPSQQTKATAVQATPICAMGHAVTQAAPGITAEDYLKITSND
jgi:hypothetical protein